MKKPKNDQYRVFMKLGYHDVHILKQAILNELCDFIPKNVPEYMILYSIQDLYSKLIMLEAKLSLNPNSTQNFSFKMPEIFALKFFKLEKKDATNTLRKLFLELFKYLPNNH